MQQSMPLCPWLVEPFARLVRAARDDRLAHAWLVTGPDGVGKLNFVHALAERLLRDDLADEPRAASPRAVVAAYARLAESGNAHADLHRVRAEDGKRTIGIEQIRDMIQSLQLTPHLGGRKVVIIECAQRMTNEAANALLKTLEEPTLRTYLLLTSARPARLPATIRSRCQRLALRAPSAERALDWLAGDGLAAEGLPRRIAARAPVLAARDLLEQGNSSKYNEIYRDIDMIYEGSADPHEVAESWHRGDLETALSCLVERLQQLIRAALVPELTNRFTEESGPLPDNRKGTQSPEALFARLAIAENLRDQFGRGINMELALKVLLLGLAPPSQRSTT